MFSIWRQQQSQKEHFSDLFMYWFWMSKGKKLNTFFQFKFSQFITKRNIINDLFTFCNYFLLLLLLFFFYFPRFEIHLCRLYSREEKNERSFQFNYRKCQFYGVCVNCECEASFALLCACDSCRLKTKFSVASHTHTFFPLFSLFCVQVPAKQMFQRKKTAKMQFSHT